VISDFAQLDIISQNEHFMNDLASKVALITGAAAGIGQRIVQTLLQEDCVVAMLDRDGTLLEQASGKLNSTGRAEQIHLFEADVRKASELRTIADEVAGLRGHIDIVVNCAGVVRVGPFSRVGTRHGQNQSQRGLPRNCG
jgi:NAD(P)-dependent dehydrogenase (short-subunit alcohol dehydrogenase family)